MDDDANDVAARHQMESLKVLSKRKIQKFIIAPVSSIDQSAEFPNGIQVVYVDRSSAADDSATLVATQSTKAGALALESLIQVANKKDSVAILKLSKTVSTTNAREDGFRAAAMKHGFTVKETNIGFGVAEAKVLAKSFLEKNPDLKFIFTPNETTTLATLLALKETNHSAKLIGFDYKAEFLEYFASGQLIGLIVQDPYQIGRKAVDLVLAGKVNAGFKEIPAIFISNKNLKSKRVVELLKSFN